MAGEHNGYSQPCSKTVSHTWRRPCEGTSLVPSWLLLPVGKQPPDNSFLTRQAGEKQFLLKWSMELRRAKKPRDHWWFHRGQQMPFYHQLPLPASPVCAISLHWELTCSQSNSSETVSRHPLNESTEHPTIPPKLSQCQRRRLWGTTEGWTDCQSVVYSMREKLWNNSLKANKNY